MKIFSNIFLKIFFCYVKSTNFERPSHFVHVLIFKEENHKTFKIKKYGPEVIILKERLKFFQT